MIRRLTDIQHMGLADEGHGLDPDLSLQKIEKIHERRKVAEVRRSNERVWRLRASLPGAERCAATAEDEFRRVQLEAPGEIPWLAWPVLGMLFSIVLTCGDTYLLAKLLEG